MVPLEVVRVERSTNGSQLVYVEHSLETVLGSYPQYSDKKVCVLSVAGPFRKGKSFLLNFLLRYLRFQRDGKSGDWLDQNEPMHGFPSKSGTASVTEGILVWPEPFLMKAGDEEVVLLLMDTQGSGDTKSRSSETTAIFALSTLVSSLTVFNVQTHLRLEDVNAVTFFSEYGRLASQEKSPFQKLIFVVRDWPDRASFGQFNKNVFLSAKLSSAKGTAIREAFQELECWHLPHPGNVVASGRFTGDSMETKEDFRRTLKSLCEHILSPACLVAKTLGKKTVALDELKDLFASYAGALPQGTLSDDEVMLKTADNLIEVSARAALADLCDKLLKCIDNSLKEVSDIWIDCDSLRSRLTDEALEKLSVAKTIGGPRYKPEAVTRLRIQMALSFSRFEQECAEKRAKELNSIIRSVVESYWNQMNMAINSSPEPLAAEVVKHILEDFLSSNVLPSTLQLLETHPLFMRRLRFELYKAKCHFDAINSRRLRVARGGRILDDVTLKDVLLCLDRDTLDGIQLVGRSLNGVVPLLSNVCLRVIIGASIDIKEGLLVRTDISVAKVDCNLSKVSTIAETGYGAAYLRRLTWLANAMRNSTLYKAQTVTVNSGTVICIADQENVEVANVQWMDRRMENVSRLWMAGGSGTPFVPAIFMKSDERFSSKTDNRSTFFCRYGQRNLTARCAWADRIDLHILDVTIQDVSCDVMCFHSITTRYQMNMSLQCSVYATDNFLRRCASNELMHILPKHPRRSGRDAIRNMFASPALTEPGILMYCFDSGRNEMQMRELRLTNFNVSERFVHNFKEAARCCRHTALVAVRITGSDPSHARKSVEYAAANEDLSYDRPTKQFYGFGSLPSRWNDNCYFYADFSDDGQLTLLFYYTLERSEDLRYWYETMEPGPEDSDCNLRLLKYIKLEMTDWLD